MLTYALGLDEDSESEGWIRQQIRGNIEGRQPPPAHPPTPTHPPTHTHTHGGMSLPGLGNVKSPEEAAQALV
jgi:hypothetical protein